MIEEKELDIHYFMQNGKYYIGQYKNDLRNGKGNNFYSNGNIEYKGDFVNGKRDGIGHFIFSF